LLSCSVSEKFTFVNHFLTAWICRAAAKAPRRGWPGRGELTDLGRAD
jgi:hypothetical protein